MRHARYEDLIDAVADAMLLVEPGGLIVAANRGATDMFCCDASQLIGHGVDSLMPERFRTKHEAHHERFMRAPSQRRMNEGAEVIGLRHNDQEFFAEISLSPTDTERILVTIVDITARKADESALRLREAQLSLFIEHVPVALAMLDKDMRYLCVSQRWLSDYGLGDQDLIGRSHPDVFPDIGHRWRGVLQRCLTGSVERMEEDRFDRADGTTLWLRWEMRPWYCDRNEVGGIVIFTEDVTERKLAQERVEQSERQFRATFEHASVGIAHLAVDGRWLRVNHKLSDIVAYTPEELLRMSFQAITHPDDLDADLALVQQLLEGRIDSYSIDQRYRRKNGSTVWVRVTGSLLRHPDGSPDYFIAVVEDIDARKQAEDTVRRLRSEMEQMLTLHVATQTAAAIAHELNQPLNAVTTYAEAALRMLGSGNPRPDKMQHAIQSASQQARRAAGVVRELMGFLNKLDTVTEALDINDLIEEAIATVQASGPTRFKMESRVETGLRPVQANRLQVEKVLVNLLRNAQEAMEVRHVDPARVTIDITKTPENDMALVSITDHGPGLDKEAARHLFEPFFTTKDKGLGMGLTVSRALIKANGGQLWLATQRGPGATFQFTLPFAP